MKRAFGFIKNLFFNKKLNDSVVYGYTAFVILYQLLYQVMPVRKVIYSLGLNAVSSLLAILGLGLFVWDLLSHRNFLKTKLSYVLIALIGVMGISALIRFDYGIVNNAKAIIWQVSQMLVIFPLFTRLNKSGMFKMIKLLFVSFSVFALPAVFVSFYQYFTRVHYTVSVDGGTIHQGFMEGRLFGVFGSMHFTTLILISMAAFAVYFGIKAKNKIFKVCYFFVAVLYFVYSTATGTRSIIIGVLCAVLPTTYFIAQKLLKDLRINKYLNVVIRCCVSIVSVVIMLVAFSVTGKVLEASNTAIYNAITESKIEVVPQQPTDEGEAQTPTQPQQTLPEQDTDIGRTDIDMENISNNRFTIWKEYIDIVFDKPISAVFGLSMGEYQKHITNEYSNKYIVQYIKEFHPSMYERGYIYDTHSAYVGALVMTGIAGVLLLFVFLILGLIRLLKALAKKQSGGLLTLLFVLVFILVTSFFDSDLFFRCTSTSVLFWLISGFAIKLAKDE